MDSNSDQKQLFERKSDSNHLKVTQIWLFDKNLFVFVENRLKYEYQSTDKIISPHFDPTFHSPKSNWLTVLMSNKFSLKL